MIENKFQKTVDKIILNSENSIIETKKNSLTYIKFEDDVKNANLDIIFKNNSEIYISNSKLNNLQLKIDIKDKNYENYNSNYAKILFLDTEVKNFKLITSEDLDYKKIKLIRSKLNF